MLIRSETLVTSWKPFYFLRESLPYQGLVLVVVIYYELLLAVFSNLSELKLKQLHIILSLSFATLSRFSRFLKDAINCLDIPSRRPRLDKYSQKSILFSSYWILQNVKFCSWSFFAIICSSYIRNCPGQKVNWLTILLDVCLVLLPATAVKTKNDATANKHNRARETLHAVLIVSVF